MNAHDFFLKNLADYLPVLDHFLLQEYLKAHLQPPSLLRVRDKSYPVVAAA